MSSWKQVKRKKKPGGRNQKNSSGKKTGNQNQQKNQGKKKNKKRQTNDGGYYVEEKKVVRKLPVGASGAPQLMKKMKQQQQKKKKKKGKGPKKKRHFNEEKFKDDSKGNWHDPNSWHDPQQKKDSDYYYMDDGKKNLINKNMAEKIRKNREKLGMSRKDFAEAINEELRVVGDYERAEIEPKTHILKKMSKVLGVNLGKTGKKLKSEKKNQYYKRD